MLVNLEDEQTIFVALLCTGTVTYRGDFVCMCLFVCMLLKIFKLYCYYTDICNIETGKGIICIGRIMCGMCTK